MKKLTTQAEIEALRAKKAKEVFENLVGILGDSLKSSTMTMLRFTTSAKL